MRLPQDTKLAVYVHLRVEELVELEFVAFIEKGGPRVTFFL